MLQFALPLFMKNFLIKYFQAFNLGGGGLFHVFHTQCSKTSFEAKIHVRFILLSLKLHEIYLIYFK